MNPLELLDRCEARLNQAQVGIAKTRKVAAVVSGVAVAGGLGMLLWKVLAEEPPVPPTDAEPSAPPNEED
jgi:hypothetical protein